MVAQRTKGLERHIPVGVGREGLEASQIQVGLVTQGPNRHGSYFRVGILEGSSEIGPQPRGRREAEHGMGTGHPNGAVAVLPSAGRRSSDEIRGHGDVIEAQRREAVAGPRAFGGAVGGQSRREGGERGLAPHPSQVAELVRPDFGVRLRRQRCEERGLEALHLPTEAREAERSMPSDGGIGVPKGVEEVRRGERIVLARDGQGGPGAVGGQGRIEQAEQGLERAGVGRSGGGCLGETRRKSGAGGDARGLGRRRDRGATGAEKEDHERAPGSHPLHSTRSRSARQLPPSTPSGTVSRETRRVFLNDFRARRFT